ncbi:hypothetical protein ACP4OV_015054 [Aristida adscensionis]
MRRMENWSMLRRVRRFFSDLRQNAPSEDGDGVTDEEAEKAKTKRIESYMSLCLCGLTSMYWKDSNALLKKLYDQDKKLGSAGAVCMTISLLSMILGLTASTFPKTAPYVTAISAHGALHAILFIVTSVHLEIFEMYPKDIVFISWGISCGLSTLYWSMSAQEPKLLFILARPVAWLICLPYYIARYGLMKLWSWLRRKDGRSHELPLYDLVKGRFHFGSAGRFHFGSAVST